MPRLFRDADLTYRDVNCSERVSRAYKRKRPLNGGVRAGSVVQVVHVSPGWRSGVVFKPMARACRLTAAAHQTFRSNSGAR